MATKTQASKWRRTLLSLPDTGAGVPAPTKVLICDNLAIRVDQPGLCRVIHVPTLLGFGVSFRTQRAAKEFCDRLLKLNPAIVNVSTNDEATKVASSYEKKMGHPLRHAIRKLASSIKDGSS